MEISEAVALAVSSRWTVLKSENAESLNESEHGGVVGRSALYFDEQNSDKHSFAWEIWPCFIIDSSRNCVESE